MSTSQDFNKMSARKMKKAYFDIGYNGTAKDMMDVMTVRTSYLNDHFFSEGIEKAFDEGRTENLKDLLTNALKKDESGVHAGHMNGNLHGRLELMVTGFLRNRTAEQLQKFLALVPEKDRQTLLQDQLGSANTVKETQALLEAGADIHADDEKALVDTVSHMRTSQWLAKEGMGKYGTRRENRSMKKYSKASLLQEEAKLRFLCEKGADFDKAIAAATAKKSDWTVEELKEAQQKLQSPPAPQKKSLLAKLLHPRA